MGMPPMKTAPVRYSDVKNYYLLLDYMFLLIFYVMYLILEYFLLYSTIIMTFPAF